MTADDSPLAVGFNRLLTLLDPEMERAGDAYAGVQRKLAKFFEWRGCPDGAMYADLTLERVARRLGEGATVTTPNPYTFIMGFAQNVLREYLRQPDRRFASLEDAQTISASTAGDPIDELGARRSEDRRFECLDQCVGKLPTEQQCALLRYHEGQARTRIDARKQLAASFGIPVSALRLRMFRIRESLERCILNCVGANSAPVK